MRCGTVVRSIKYQLYYIVFGEKLVLNRGELKTKYALLPAFSTSINDLCFKYANDFIYADFSLDKTELKECFLGNTESLDRKIRSRLIEIKRNSDNKKNIQLQVSNFKAEHLRKKQFYECKDNTFFKQEITEEI